MALRTGIDPFAPCSYARSDNGWLYIANGIDTMQKWNGISSSMVRSGVPAPTTVPTLAAGAAGSPNGTYTVYIRHVDDDGFVSNLLPAAATVTVSSQQISVSNLPTSVPSRVNRIQILRNTNGQALTFYVEAEQAGSYPGTATLTMSDTTLATQTAVPLFDEDGNSLASRYDIPRTDKPIIVAHQGRMFMAGHSPYRTGHVEVTSGSNTVRGVGTLFTSDMIGRLFHVYGHDPNYTISNVDVSDQALILSTNYAGATNKFAVYTVESAPANRNVLFWSEAGLPDAWPSSNGIEVGDSGDEITGLLLTQTFLYVLQRRSIYRLTYSQHPGDGAAYRVALRGCVNHRCSVREGGTTYMLDDQGVFRFAGDETVEQLTPPIQSLFWPDASEGKVDWQSSTYFHAWHDAREKVIRWFVTLGAGRYPRHALAFDYAKNQWWTEVYPFPIGASTLVHGVDALGVCGGPSRRVFCLRGTLDAPAPMGRTTRATVDSAGAMHITDNNAIYHDVSKIAGRPVSIVAGRGKGQTRLISYVTSSGKLVPKNPWLVEPDSTSKYQIGAIEWNWRSRQFQWLDDEYGNSRRIALQFRPTETDSQLDVKLYENHDKEAVLWDGTDPIDGEPGVRVTESYPDAEVDLEYPKNGRRQLRMIGNRDEYGEDLDAISFELSGFSAESEMRIEKIILDGAEEPSQRAQDRERNSGELA